MPPSASPSDGGCAEGSFGLTALEGWGRGAFPQPWVGGMQPLRPSARQLPDPKLPPLPHRRAAGVAEGIAPEDPGDGSPTRADLDTTRVPGDTGPCHPSGAPSPDHGRLCQDWDTVGYEDHGTGDGSGVGGAGTHHLWGHGCGELPSLAATPHPSILSAPPQHPKAPEHPYPAGEQRLGKGWARCGGARHPPVHFLHRGHSCPHLRPPPQVSPQKTRKKQCEFFFFFSLPWP